MSVRVGINGFGRIGRLALRAAWGWPELEFVHINETGGDAATAAHLLHFDSIHGRWGHTTSGEGGQIFVGETPIRYSSVKDPGAVPWAEAGVEIVLEATGKFRTPEQLEAIKQERVDAWIALQAEIDAAALAQPVLTEIG